MEHPSEGVLQGRRTDEVTQRHVRECCRDEIGQVTSWSRDRSHFARDWPATGGFNHLFQLVRQRSVALAGRLGRHLERDSIERGVITGSMTTHKCLDVLT